MSIYRLNVTIIKYFLDLQSQSKKRQSVVPIPKLREGGRHTRQNARVVELVDTLDSKSNEGNLVWVRVPPLVQKKPQQFAEAFLI